jgi:hypothetical protein
MMHSTLAEISHWPIDNSVARRPYAQGSGCYMLPCVVVAILLDLLLPHLLWSVAKLCEVVDGV